MKNTATKMEEGLQMALTRYARHGAVKNVQVAFNLLKEPNFRQVTFADGYVANFCLSADKTFWFRNEQKRRVSR